MTGLLDRGKVMIIQNTLQTHQNYLKIPVLRRRVAISSKAKYREKNTWSHSLNGLSLISPSLCLFFRVIIKGIDSLGINSYSRKKLF